jgi:hypothetical protein
MAKPQFIGADPLKLSVMPLLFYFFTIPWHVNRVLLP